MGSTDCEKNGDMKGVAFHIAEEKDDDSPHPLFCEVEILRTSPKDGSLYWKEIARYVRFEEVVEEAANRWSKPHVASLSYPAVHKLQTLLNEGILILNADGQNVEELIALVIQKCSTELHLPMEQTNLIADLLQARHRHKREGSHPMSALKTTVHQRALSRRVSSAQLSSQLNLQRSRSEDILDPSKHNGHVQRGSDVSDETNKLSTTVSDDMNKRRGSTFSTNLTEEQKRNLAFLRHLTEDTLVANVLIGGVEGLAKEVCVLARFDQPSLLGEMSEVTLPTKFVFLYLYPAGGDGVGVDVGRAMAAAFVDEAFRVTAFKAEKKSDIVEGVQRFIDQAVLLPRGEWDPAIRIEPPTKMPSKKPEEEEDSHDDEALRRTGRFFGGLVADIKRKAPWYLSDFRDALHFQTFASTIFIYIACLTPIITFGGLLGKQTDNHMAAMEGILSGAICGTTFALFAGQPLNIVGSTGPMLVFEGILFTFCQGQHWDFMTFRVWVGFWSTFFLLILVAFDLSALVRYITRFSEEGFASLISIIFIYEAVEKLLGIEENYGINKSPDDLASYDCRCNRFNSSNNITWNYTAYLHKERVDCTAAGGRLEGPGCSKVPDVFLFSVLTSLGTFFIAIVLKKFKFSPFFPTIVREIVSDFSVVIAVVTMTLTDYFVRLHTPKLHVPTEFKPTRSDRGWLIPVTSPKNPWWSALVAFLPALLVTILIFLDQQITAVIVNRKEHKLKKGPGYHLDLFVVAIQIAVCSIMGLPWFVAATVRALTHVLSLKKESEATAPGEKPDFFGIREQRVTNFMVSLLIGLSVFMTNLFRNIPMPVLYGVFLYMGISSLGGVQFVERLLLLFMPEKYQPDRPYLRLVRTWRVHVFTLVQLICLAGLWVVKQTKSISIFFPVMILVMCIVRKLLECFFTRGELRALDNVLPGNHLRRKLDEEKLKGKNETGNSVQMTSGRQKLAYVNSVDITDEKSPPVSYSQDTTKL